jgi:hypothetical protein
MQLDSQGGGSKACGPLAINCLYIVPLFLLPLLLRLPSLLFLLPLPLLPVLLLLVLLFSCGYSASIPCLFLSARAQSVLLMVAV